MFNTFLLVSASSGLAAKPDSNIIGTSQTNLCEFASLYVIKCMIPLTILVWTVSHHPLDALPGESTIQSTPSSGKLNK
jgi:hypothetical protein